MVCKIIWVDRVALRGVEAATSYKELAIVTNKITHKKSINRRQLSKAILIKGYHIIKNKIGK